MVLHIEGREWIGRRWVWRLNHRHKDSNLSLRLLSAHPRPSWTDRKKPLMVVGALGRPHQTWLQRVCIVASRLALSASTLQQRRSRRKLAATTRSLQFHVAWIRRPFPKCTWTFRIWKLYKRRGVGTSVGPWTREEKLSKHEDWLRPENLRKVKKIKKSFKDSMKGLKIQGKIQLPSSRASTFWSTNRFLAHWLLASSQISSCPFVPCQPKKLPRHCWPECRFLRRFGLLFGLQSSPHLHFGCRIEEEDSGHPLPQPLLRQKKWFQAALDCFPWFLPKWQCWRRRWPAFWQWLSRFRVKLQKRRWSCRQKIWK